MTTVDDPDGWLRDRLASDGHVHSLFSDGTDDPAANLVAAGEAGLARLVMADHVRASTTWLPAYVSAVDRVRDGAPTQLLVGVETKLLDTTGLLDLPRSLQGIDLVLIADHQYPGPDGPVQPGVMGDALRARRMDPEGVVRGLVAAMVAAIGRVDRPAVLAHPFSILPKMGLTEADIPDDALRLLASRCRETGTAVEVNEKWRCPGPLVARVLHEAGVELVAGSDAHRASDVGRYGYVREVLESLVAPRVSA